MVTNLLAIALNQPRAVEAAGGDEVGQAPDPDARARSGFRFNRTVQQSVRGAVRSNTERVLGRA